MRLACLAIGLLWNALAGADVLYRLPWPDGLSFMFTQVADGRITTHITKATLNAVDVAMPAGVPVLAARAGTIEAIEARHGASRDEDPITFEGNFVRVRHDDGTTAVYAHLRYRGVVVAAGEVVATGQLLAYSGATGDVLAPHLHFAVLRDDASLPIKFYVGQPPVAFAPRAGLDVRAFYSGPAKDPRTAREAEPLVPWTLPAGDEPSAWRSALLWIACGAAALAWFWRFSRK